MRLLNVYTLQFAEFHGPDKPIYYVTSHRWTDDEMTYKDFLKGRKKDSKGYKKIEGFCTYVRGLNEKVRRIDWIWIDTCCIDKSSSAEITESINSMWKLHTESEHCIAYLHDVRGLGPREIDATLRMADFRNSEWFKRGKSNGCQGRSALRNPLCDSRKDMLSGLLMRFHRLDSSGADCT